MAVSTPESLDGRASALAGGFSLCCFWNAFSAATRLGAHLTVDVELRAVGVQRHLQLRHALLLIGVRLAGIAGGGGGGAVRRPAPVRAAAAARILVRRAGGKAGDRETADSEGELAFVHGNPLGRRGRRANRQSQFAANVYRAGVTVQAHRDGSQRMRSRVTLDCPYVTGERPCCARNWSSSAPATSRAMSAARAFPARDIDARRRKGVGWTHSNLMQTAFGPILDTPFGTAGDLMIVPDPAAEVRVDFADGSAPEHFFLGDIRNTDGTPWECCPREFLRRAIAALNAASGLRLVAAFEQEFVYTGNQHRDGDAYSLNAFRRQGTFGESFVAAMRAAGVTPDSFLAEYGTRQFEVTVAPAPALTAADHAVITREMARAAAHRHGLPRVVLADARGVRRRQRRAHPHEPAGCVRRADDLCGDRTDGPQHGGAAFLRRRAAASAGDLRHHRALAGVVSAADAEPLGADADRHRAAGSRCGAARLPGVRRGRCRPTRRGSSISSSASAMPPPVRTWRWARSSSPAPTGCSASSACRRRPTASMNCRIRSARRWTTWRRARRWPAGSGPVFLEAYLRHKRSEVQHVAEWAVNELCNRYAEVY